MEIHGVIMHSQQDNSILLKLYLTVFADSGIRSYNYMIIFCSTCIYLKYC